MPLISPFRGTRRFFGPAAGLLAMTAVAVAQTPPAKTAPAPAAPPSAAAAAAPPSAAQIALGRDLIVANGIGRSFAIVIPQYMDQIGTSLTQTRPELIRDLNTVLEQLKPEFDSQANEMIGLAAGVYARLMTEEQLKQAVAFFNSDAGRRYVESQPTFMTDTVGLMQGWQSRISTRMVERIRQEMRKKGHEI